MEVAIIGAGLGGLTTGALLANKGHNIEIFEKEKILGGRTLTLDGSNLTLDEYQKILHRFDLWIPFSEPDIETIFDKKMLHGYRLDLGFHLLGFIDNSPIVKTLERFGQHVEIFSSKFGVIHPEKGVMSTLAQYLSATDKMRLVPLAARLLSARKSTLEDLQKIPLSETLERFCKGKIKDVLGIAGKLISTINDLDSISTGESIRVLEQWIRGARQAGSYSKFGSISLSQAYANIITAKKGKINLDTKVENILQKDNIANGVEIEGVRKYYDAIISNLPIKDLFYISNEKWFPNEYVKNIKSLEGTGSVCAYYALKRINPELIGKPFAFIEKNLDIDGKDAAGVIDFLTADPNIGLSPKNRYLVQAYIICTPNEAINKKKVSMLRETLDNKMEVLLPGFRQHLDFVIYPTSWHLDGVAKTIDNEKPDSVTPLKNLYLVGDCIKSTGIGMNCAVDSGITLSEKIF